MRKDLIFGKSVVESLPLTVVSGGGDNGNDVSTLRKYAAKHILHIGAIGTTITVKLQESSVGGGSGYTDVPAAQMIGGVNLVTILDSADNTATQIAGFDLKQFQRIVTVSGAGSLTAVAVLADNLSV